MSQASRHARTYSQTAGKPVGRLSPHPRLWPFVLMLLSLHVHAAAEIAVGPHLAIKPWNVAIVVSILLWVGLALFGWRPRFPPTAALPYAFFVLFVVWIGITSFHSPQPEAATAVFFAQVENALLFVVLASAFANSSDRQALNRLIFKLGVLVATVSLLLYAAGLRLLIDPVASSDAIERTIGYVYDRGLALRLTGFAEDPNFYSLYMGISLLAGLNLRRVRWTWIGLTVIGLSLFLAMSRTFVAVFVVTCLLVCFGNRAVRSRQKGGAERYGRSLLLVILSLGAVGAAIVTLSPDIREFVSARVTSMPDQSRLVLWRTTLQQWDHVILGDGPRSIDWAVGNFSHNTFMDVIVETGLVGTLLWGGFVLLVTLVAFRRRGDPEMTPWFHGWLIVLGMASTFSLVYSPIFVIFAAALTGDHASGRRDTHTPTV